MVAVIMETRQENLYLGGFIRDFKYTYKSDINSNEERFEYVKPVLYSAGNGL